MTHPAITDSQVLIIKRAAAGDESAFSDLFHSHYEAVYNYAVWLTGDQALAADVTQDAFIRAHRRLDSFGSPWNFRAWIMRLARNRYIDLQRASKKVVSLDPERPLPGVEPDPEGLVESQEKAERVRQVIQTLPDLYREALALREFGHHSYQDIADIMDISLSYVRVLIHRARGMFGERYGIQLLAEDPLPACDALNELLDSFQDQAPLSEFELEMVEEHLATCATCQQRRRQLIALSALFAWLPRFDPPVDLAPESQPETPSTEAPQNSARWLPWAGMLAVFVLLLGLAATIVLADIGRQGGGGHGGGSDAATEALDSRSDESAEPFCGDGVCQPNNNEDSANCALDCQVGASTAVPTQSNGASGQSIESPDDDQPAVSPAACVDDGVCAADEQAIGSCRDCSSVAADQCGVPCDETCSTGLSCVSGVCWDAETCANSGPAGGGPGGGPDGGGGGAQCGNGIVEAGESCDGNNNACPNPAIQYCTNSCTCEILP